MPEEKEIRTLDIDDLERIERFRHAGYGGSVSDALSSLGVRNTVFSARFKALRQGMQLVGRAMPIKAHSMADVSDIPGVQLEDEVVLLGRQGPESITAEQMAAWAQTINYEIVTRADPFAPREYKGMATESGESP